MLGSKIHLQHLIENGHLFLTKWAKFFKIDIDIEDKCLTQELIDEFHKANLKVNCWTIDSIENVRKFEKMGVDYITTNEFDQDA